MSEIVVFSSFRRDFRGMKTSNTMLFLMFCDVPYFKQNEKEQCHEKSFKFTKTGTVK